MAASQDNTIQFDESFVLKTNDERPDYSLTTDIISDLYAVRFRSYFRYLEDWNPYTDVKTVLLRSLARRTAEHNRLAMIELSNILAGLGSTPKKQPFTQSDMDSTYTDWGNLLPRLVQSQEESVTATDNALKALAGAPAEDCVRPVLEKHLARDRQVLEQFNKWLAEFN